MQHEKEIAESIRLRHAYFQGNIQAWVFRNSKAFKALSLWLGFIATMIAYSMAAIKWPFAQVSDVRAWYGRIVAFFPSLSCLVLSCLVLSCLVLFSCKHAISRHNILQCQHLARAGSCQFLLIRKHGYLV
jgi:hypothetical protein